ncbi:MAG: LPS assembly lipoprotein LptE [Elusimicrobiales bacterium]
MKKIMGALLLAASALSGCADSPDVVYRPYPQILPQHVTKLAVRPFLNRTEQFGLEDAFNVQLVQTFQFDGTYPVTSEAQADGVITGEIWRYILTPTQYNAAQVSTAYKLTVLFKVRFIDVKANAVLWEEPAMEGIQIYSDSSLPGGMTELAARQAIWERMSQDIVTRAIAGFGSVSSQSERRIVGGPQNQAQPAAANASPAPAASTQPAVPAQSPGAAVPAQQPQSGVSSQPAAQPAVNAAPAAQPAAASQPPASDNSAVPVVPAQPAQ